MCHFISHNVNLFLISLAEDLQRHEWTAWNTCHQNRREGLHCSLQEYHAVILNKFLRGKKICRACNNKTLQRRSNSHEPFRKEVRMVGFLANNRSQPTLFLSYRSALRKILSWDETWLCPSWVKVPYIEKITPDKWKTLSHFLAQVNVTLNTSSGSSMPS